MSPAERKLRVLFLCTANSCRSQMAEGWARALRGDSVQAFSAGTAPRSVDPRAMAVMAEAGVDLTSHRSKSVEDAGGPFDIVVTVCDSAREACPTVPGVRTIHVPFDDPPRLAADARSEAEALEAYRRVRDQIRDFVRTLPESLEEMPVE